MQHWTMEHSKRPERLPNVCAMTPAKDPVLADSSHTVTYPVISTRDDPLEVYGMTKEVVA